MSFLKKNIQMSIQMYRINKFLQNIYIIDNSSGNKTPKVMDKNIVNLKIN